MPSNSAEPWKPAPTRIRRVLVVDDNAGAAKILALMLKRFWGHHVETAHDGPAAVELAHSYQPEVVFLDISLPGLSGYEVAALLRQEPQFDHTLLVALTGYSHDEDRRRSQEAGFDEHVVKPASVDVLENLFKHPKLANGHG